MRTETEVRDMIECCEEKVRAIYKSLNSNDLTDDERADCRENIAHQIAISKVLEWVVE